MERATWLEKTAPNSSRRPSCCHGGSTSSTSWPSERSSSLASSDGLRGRAGRRRLRARGGCVVAAIRSRPGSRPARRSERLGGRRRPRGVARLVAREHIEDRRGVVDRAREHAVDRRARSRRARGPRRCVPGSASGPRARSRPRGYGSSRRRRCHGRPAASRSRPPLPRRRRSRRVCVRDPTDCAWGRTDAPRSRAGCRTRAASSCRGPRTRRPSGGVRRCGRSRSMLGHQRAAVGQAQALHGRGCS